LWAPISLSPRRRAATASLFPSGELGRPGFAFLRRLAASTRHARASAVLRTASAGLYALRHTTQGNSLCAISLAAPGTAFATAGLHP